MESQSLRNGPVSLSTLQINEVITLCFLNNKKLNTECDPKYSVICWQSTQICVWSKSNHKNLIRHLWQWKKHREPVILSFPASVAAQVNPSCLPAHRSQVSRSPVTTERYPVCTGITWTQLNSREGAHDTCRLSTVNTFLWLFWFSSLPIGRIRWWKSKSWLSWGEQMFVKPGQKKSDISVDYLLFF